MKVRLRVVWAALALAGAAAVAADVAAVAHVALTDDAAAVCPPHGISDPVEVATRFLATAVERRDLANAYALATPSLRGARTCREWARGGVPVDAFRDIDWSRASYQTVAGGEGQVVLRVLLYRPGAAEPVPYLMEIQTEASEPGWHVGWFGKDRWYSPPAGTSPAA